MAVQTITVEAISHKFEKFAVMAGDKWYNTKAEFAAEWPEKPVVGDTITFDDGGKKYLGRMKIVAKGDGPRAGSAPAKSGGGGGYSSLGVEVGHASNLAMRMMEQDRMDCPHSVGSTEYYKLFIERTETVYKLMGGLKKKLGAPAAPVVTAPVEAEPKPTPVEDSSDDLSDLF